MNHPNPSEMVGLPDWLVPDPGPSPSLLAKRAAERLARSLSHVSVHVRRHDSPSQVIRDQYQYVLEPMLDAVRTGLSLREAIENDVRNINAGDFLEWVMTSPARKKRYDEAKKIATYIMDDDTQTIADAEGSMEDVARSALRVNTRKWRMAAWNRERFGDVKQIDATITNETKVTFQLTRPFAAPEKAIEGEFVESLPDDSADAAD